MKIVLASNNEHKLKEFKKILKDYEVVSLSDIGFIDDIEETGSTFLENALLKANAIRDFLGTNNKSIIIADDSGLCVDSIGGEPGIYSARYSGDHGNSRLNREKLIKNLQGKDRKAYFLCMIVVLYPDGNYKSFEGKTYGNIIDEERGNTGFGYDSIFLSDDLGKTFGEATEEEKNSVSHRGRAIEKMLKEL
jgi:XTP/dITP diphosphohydrolase